MKKIKDIARDPKVQVALSSLINQETNLVELIIAVQQIPAPTFEEAKRACFVEEHFLNIGLQEVHQDKLHNVYGCWPGTKSESSIPVIITAHSDTVFPIATELENRREDQLLFGPGIGDNSTGVAGIIALAKMLNTFNLQPKADIWFVVNVGEEGLGNLRGMRAVVERFDKNARYIVVEGGSFGQIIYKGLGVRRYRITIDTHGGHSWGNFGQPSAIHELGKLIAEIAKLQVPLKPKTTYNMGVIEGGTTVNSIASFASVLLDLRSEQSADLEKLVAQVKNIVESRRMATIKQNQDVVFHMELVGNRPAGQISRNDSLVRMAESSLKEVGWPHVTNIIGSTDANIPLSQKISCVCVGLTTSGNSHRIDEYIDLTHLQSGMKQLFLLALAAANY